MNTFEERVAKAFNICCSHGNVPLDLVKFHNYPEFLKNLLEGSDQYSKEFLGNISGINDSISFARISYSHVDPAVKTHVTNRGGAGNVVTVRGRLQQTVYKARAGEDLRYGQRFFVSREDGLRSALTHPHVGPVPEELMAQVYDYIRANNAFAKAYVMLADTVERLEQEGQSVEEVAVGFRTNIRTSGERRDPNVDDLCILFTSHEEMADHQGFRIQRTTEGDKEPWVKCNLLQAEAEPMAFVLFYPKGGYGWHPNIPSIKRTGKKGNVSMAEYFSAKFMMRQDEEGNELFNPILLGRLLTGHYACQAWMKTEQQTLRYFRENAKTLKAESYSALVRRAEELAKEKHLDVGRIIVVPAKYVGSRRYFLAMCTKLNALCAAKGKPDLFVTFTLNPRCKEITRMLKKDQEPGDRPDIVTRVFHSKLIAFIRLDLQKNQVFGKMIAMAYRVEFSPVSGLPHCHMFIILEEKYKPKTPEAIDQLVCAEMPDKETQGELYERVKKYMIHVCEATFCRGRAGSCRKKFPRKFQPSTSILPGGEILYRRRDDGVKHETTVGGRRVEFDNRNVIPYNKWAIARHDCHINVEVCNSLKVCKYITKYATKTHSSAAVTITSTEVDVDEVQEHIHTRIVSSYMACHRIFRFRMAYMSHSVQILPVHLEGQQEVMYEEGDEDEALEKAQLDTRLMAFFNLNIEDPNARNLRYTEVPILYRFDKKAHQFVRRSEKDITKIVATMWEVHPAAAEKYHLRILLLHAKGPTSYEDLKTVTLEDGNEVVCETFKDACEKLGYVRCDQMWTDTLREASLFASPSELRQVFAAILAHNNPIDCRQLWDTFQTNLIQDYLNRPDTTGQDAIAEALDDIRVILESVNRTYNSYELPQVTQNFSRDLHFTEAEVNAVSSKLTPEQRLVYDTITEATEGDGPNRLFFLDAPGGCGKTYTQTAICMELIRQGKKVCNFATTGIAANLLINGTTVHSGFQFPPNATTPFDSSMKPYDPKARILAAADLITIDEVSMMSSYALEAVSRCLEMATGVDKPFGNKTVLLMGDFRQTLPVVPGGNDCDILDLTISRSQVFKLFTRLQLLKNMRAGNYPRFCDFLLRLGNGEKDGRRQSDPEGYEIPITSIQSCTSMQELVDAVFGNSIRQIRERHLREAVIVTPYADSAAEMNSVCLELNPNIEDEYLSINEQDPNEETKLTAPTEYLETLEPQGVPPHKLHLKVGCVAMIVRNLDIDGGILNGTRVLIRELYDHVIQATVLTGSSQGETIVIPRIVFRCFDSGYTFNRIQFPLILAYALTINKAQGQSVTHLGVYLPTPVFAHGQLYVALSRARNPRNVHMFVPEGMRQHMLPDGTVSTVNIVWQTVFPRDDELTGEVHPTRGLSYRL